MCTLRPLLNKNIAFPLFFVIVGLIVTVEASLPIEWGPSDTGNRENNVIFISRDISSPPHYHSTVMNGSFCPHNHERTCHLSVSPNWLFTTFQHRQTDTFLIVLSLSFSLAPQCKSLTPHFLHLFIFTIWLKVIARLQQHSCDLDKTTRNSISLKVL